MTTKTDNELIDRLISALRGAGYEVKHITRSNRGGLFDEGGRSK